MALPIHRWGAARNATQRDPQRRTRLIKLIALTLAAALVGTIAILLPVPLRVSTDIVGYPIYAAFNVDRMIDLYYLLVLVYPVAAIGFYLAITRFLGRPAGVGLTTNNVLATKRAAAAARHASSAATLGAVLRQLAVGSVLGLELAVMLNAGPVPTLLAAGLAAVLYAAIVWSAAFFWHRGEQRRSSLQELNARINITAAPLVVLGVAGVSAFTQITVRSDGRVYHEPWFPWWFAAVLTVGLIAWLGRRAWQTNDGALLSLETSILIFLVAPIAIYLVTATIGVGVRIDLFHNGEQLAPARMLANGAFPWRDLLTIHGPLEDGLWPLLALRVYGDSFAAIATALQLVIYPLGSAALFICTAWIARQNRILIGILSLIVVGGTLVPPVGARFIFWPLLLLLLAAVLERPWGWLSALLGAALALEAILITEMQVTVPAIAVVLLLADSFRRTPEQPLAAAFHRSLFCIAGGLAVAVSFLALLIVRGALGAYLDYYLTFINGHALSGGLPLLWYWNALFVFEFMASVAGILYSWWYFSKKVLRRTAINTTDWIGAAAAIGALLYFIKYFSRADANHLDQAYLVALPLVAFVAARIFASVDRWARRLLRTSARWAGARPASLAGLALVLMLSLTTSFARPSLLVSLTGLVGHYRPTVAAEPAIPRLGPGESGLDAATYDDLNQILHRYLRPNDWVFDFSDEPGLYYYLLDFTPHVRYDEIMAVGPEAAQKDLVTRLQQDPPRLVVFTNDRFGFPAIDGIANMVRYYDVAQYILDHYRPLLSTHTQVIYGLDSADLSPAAVNPLSLHEPVVTDSLYFRSFACDWGYAPNFLKIDPPTGATQGAPVTLAIRPAPASESPQQIALSVPPGVQWSAYRWLEISAPAGFRADSWTLSDFTQSEKLREVRFKTMADSPSSLRVYVGSCSQWHGYQGPTLYLRYTATQDIASIRLLP